MIHAGAMTVMTDRDDSNDRERVRERETTFHSLVLGGCQAVTSYEAGGGGNKDCCVVIGALDVEAVDDGRVHALGGVGVERGLVLGAGDLARRAEVEWGRHGQADGQRKG